MAKAKRTGNRDASTPIDISPAWPRLRQPRSALPRTAGSSEGRIVRQAAAGEEFLLPAGPGVGPRVLTFRRKYRSYGEWKIFGRSCRNLTRGQNGGLSPEE